MDVKEESFRAQPEDNGGGRRGHHRDAFSDPGVSVDSCHGPTASNNDVDRKELDREGSAPCTPCLGAEKSDAEVNLEGAGLEDIPPSPPLPASLTFDPLLTLPSIEPTLLEASLLKILHHTAQTSNLDPRITQMILEGGKDNWEKFTPLFHAGGRYAEFVCMVGLYQRWKEGLMGEHRWLGIEEGLVEPFEEDEEEWDEEKGYVRWLSGRGGGEL